MNLPSRPNFRMILVLILAILLPDFSFPVRESSDNHVRDRVVLLTSSIGSCTGVEIKSPSGKVYTLTAKHCSELIEPGTNTLTAEDEAGNHGLVTMIALDQYSDLMLMTGMGTKSLEIAKNYEERHQSIHTMTHGKGMPSYRTNGEILKQEDLTIPLFLTLSPTDLDKCNRVSGRVDIGGQFLPVCVIDLRLMMTTAIVVPGSSGGPMLNDRDEVLGIVSITEGGMFSGMVTIDDIHRFLMNR